MVLEGGYNVKFVGKMAASAIKNERKPIPNDRVPVFEKKNREQGEQVTKEVKKFRQVLEIRINDLEMRSLI